MAILGSADITAMFDDLLAAGGGVAVVLGADSTNGLMDVNPRELFGDGEMPALRAEDEVLWVETGALSALAPSVALTIGGSAYTVQDSYRVGDGGTTAVVVRPS